MNGMQIPSRYFRTLAAAGAVLLSASAASAQTTDTTSSSRWIQVAQSTAIRVSVDPTRIRVLDNGHLRIWSRWDYAGGKIIDGKRAAHALSQDELDCDGERTMTSSNIAYDRNGAVVRAFTDPYPQWLAAVPDSLMEGVLQAVCSAVRGQN